MDKATRKPDPKKPNPKKRAGGFTSGPRKGKWVYLRANGLWDYDFDLWTKRYYGPTGCSAKADAERVARDVREEKRALHIRVHGKPGIPTKQRDAALEAAVDRFIATEAHKDVGHVDTRTRLHNLVDVLGERTMLSTIDDEAVVRLISTLELRDARGDPECGKMSEDRVNDHVKTLRRMMRHAVGTWKFFLPDMPDWPRHTLPDDPRKREATFDELDAIGEVWREDFWPALEFLFDGAQRLTNSIGVTWSQVDFVLKVIRFKVKAPARSNRRKRRDPEKRRKYAEIPMTPALERILLIEWNRPDRHPTAVFTYVAQRTMVHNKSGKQLEMGKRYPLTVANFAHYWGTVRNRLGIKDLRIHDLRRTRASLMLRATGDVTKVQKLLVHSRIETTASTYAHVATDDLRKAMETTSAYEAMLRARRDELRGAAGAFPAPEVRFPAGIPGEDPSKGLTHWGSEPFSSTSDTPCRSSMTSEEDENPSSRIGVSDCAGMNFRRPPVNARPFVINLHFPGDAPNGSIAWRNFRRNPGVGDEPMVIQLPGFPANTTEFIRAFARAMQWRPIRHRLNTVFSELNPTIDIIDVSEVGNKQTIPSKKSQD